MPTIGRNEFNEAMRLYLKLVNSLPVELQEAMPNFETFIYPEGHLNYGSWNNLAINIAVSAASKRKFDIINGPHAKALLAAYAARRLTGNDNNQGE